MKLICKDPCTFFSTDRNIHVMDENKNSFYFHPNREQFINFNLPIGEYYCDNKIKQTIFNPYEKFIMPYKFIAPSEFKIVVSPNEKKATISIPKKTITVDPKVAYHKYKPATIFVLGHEIAHTTFGGNILNNKGEIVFNAEKACDNQSKNWMLANGYNPTQIKFAVDLILSSQDRRNCIHNDTIKQPNFRR